MRVKTYLRERSSGYTAIFYDPDRQPQQKYVTLRTSDKRIARRRITEMEKKMSQGEYDPWQDNAPEEGVLVTEAIERYLKARSDRRPKTLRADRSTLTLFAETLSPGFMLAHVEERHVRAFLDRPDLSDATLYTYHTRLKAFFSWCVEQNLIRQNPADGVDKPKVHRTEKKFFTREQVERLVRCIDADVALKAQEGQVMEGEVLWLKDVVRFAVGTGMRRSEVCNMRWSWINLTEGLVTVRRGDDFQPKSGHERTIPVRGDALDVLYRLHDERTTEADTYVFRGYGDERLNATYLSKRFKHYVRLAKLSDDFSFHSLRHTYISWMIMDGVPVPVVQKLAGHADIKTTMGYAHLAPNTLSRAVEQVFGAV